MAQELVAKTEVMGSILGDRRFYSCTFTHC